MGIVALLAVIGVYVDLRQEVARLRRQVEQLSSDLPAGTSAGESSAPESESVERTTTAATGPGDVQPRSQPSADSSRICVHRRSLESVVCSTAHGCTPLSQMRPSYVRRVQARVGNGNVHVCD